MPFRLALLPGDGVGPEVVEAAVVVLRAIEQRFGVSFEQACHRLSTLQRSDARGVPFFFVRVDPAGNVSKRFSAAGFPFARGRVSWRHDQVDRV